MRSSNFAPFLGPDVADWPIATNPGAAMFWSLLGGLCCKTLVETADEP